MGVKDSFMSASTMLKVVLVLLLLANFFNWIAFTTTGWLEVIIPGSTSQWYGIWRVCGKSSLLVSCETLAGTALDWYVAFQAFSIFGFVLVNVAHVLVTLYLFVGRCAGNKEVGLATGITGIAGGVTWFLAVMIYAGKHQDHSIGNFGLEYSFALAFIGLVLSAIGGIIMIVAQSGGRATEPSG